MSATNYTTNLNLSQFGNTDMPAWRQDYNGDMLKIDNAYTADISGATAETSADPSDYMKFYDVSATTNKKILISDLLKGAKVEDLTDTDITTPVDDDGLVYDSTSQKWENKQITTKEQWQKNGAYNLAYMEFNSQVVNGVTFTVNADGSITLNNTATAATSVHFLITSNASKVGLKEGETYKLVGLTPTTPECYLKVNCQYNSANHVAEDAGNGAIFTFTGTSYADFTYDFYLIIPNGTAFNNDTIYPMITTDLNATYDDYVPHAKTNRELTEKIDAYAKYNLYDYSTNGCTVYGTGVRIGNMAVLQGKWFKSAGLAGGTDYITSLPSDLIPSEDMTGSGILVRQSDGSIEPSLPKVTTTGVVYESSTVDVSTSGSFSIVYRVK